MINIKLYAAVNSLMMAMFGFCSSSVLLVQFKQASPEMFIIVNILGLLMGALVGWLLTNVTINQSAIRHSITVVLLDAIAYSSIDFYAAATGDLNTRWLANTLVLTITSSLTSNIWEDLKERSGEGRKHQAFLGSTQSIGVALGMFLSLVASLYFSYRIDTKSALVLQASVSWLENAVLIYMLKKYNKDKVE